MEPCPGKTSLSMPLNLIGSSTIETFAPKDLRALATEYILLAP